MTTTSGIANRCQCLYTAHPTLLVDFCGNCGARLWGEGVCRECGHKREKPRRSNAEASGISSCGEQKQAD